MSVFQIRHLIPYTPNRENGDGIEVAVPDSSGVRVLAYIYFGNRAGFIASSAPR